MPRKNAHAPLAKARNITFLALLVALLSCLSLPKQYVNWMMPTVSAKAKLVRGITNDDDPSSVASPGAVSFSAPSYSVREGDGSAKITLTRTGGSDGALTTEITLMDVTTSPADYIYSPGSLDTTFNASRQVGTAYYPQSMVYSRMGK